MLDIVKMPNEEVFKTAITEFATWVPEDAREMLNRHYAENVKQYKHGKKHKNEDVFFKYTYEAVEQLAHNKIFEGIWLKRPNGSTSNQFVCMFYDYKTITPKISKADKDARIEDCLKALHKILRTVNSDASITTCFEVAYMNVLTKHLGPMGYKINDGDNNAAGYDEFTLSGCGLNACNFISCLHEELKTQKMRTHAYLPRRKSTQKLLEKTFFVLKTSAWVIEITWKMNHTKTAEILNLIRPDLGRFTSNAISKTVNSSTLKEDYNHFLR